MQGIYRIHNTLNGKLYIGSSTNIQKRWNQHREDLLSNRHCNSYLQNSFNKYGVDSFVYEVLELVEDVNDLVDREIIWIKFYDTRNRKYGYNLYDMEDAEINGIAERLRAKLQSAMQTVESQNANR